MEGIMYSQHDRDSLEYEWIGKVQQVNTDFIESSCAILESIGLDQHP
jgi:hypothetical protein